MIRSATRQSESAVVEYKEGNRQTRKIRGRDEKHQIRSEGRPGVRSVLP